MNPIQSPAELYAHAIAIEEEAARRYGELARAMQARGEHALREVLAMLEDLEREHLRTLRDRTDGVELPAVAEGAWRWGAGAPETLHEQWTFRLASPRQALALALEGERRAQAFFERVFLTAADPGLRALAQEMALDESAHIALIEKLLDNETLKGATPCTSTS